MSVWKKDLKQFNDLVRIYCAFVMFSCVTAIAAEPTPSPSASPTTSASPASTITQSVSELSAQRAATERSKIYRSGAAYGSWLDQLANDRGNAILRRAVFEPVTWR